MDEFWKMADNCSDKDKDKDLSSDKTGRRKDQIRLIEYRLLGCLRSGMGYYRHYGIYRETSMDRR